MMPENRIPTHPGVSVQRINELVRGKRGITPETAWLLAPVLAPRAVSYSDFYDSIVLACADCGDIDSETALDVDVETMKGDVRATARVHGAGPCRPHPKGR